MIKLVIDVIIDSCSAAEWTPPTQWTGPYNVLYRNFDNMDCLILMEGTELRHFDAMAPGKVRGVQNKIIRVAELMYPQFTTFLQ